MKERHAFETELAVVGAGMAGLSAALFSARRSVPTHVIGGTGQLVYAAGLLDLLAVHPVAEQRTWVEPFAGLEALIRDHPNHPYARVEPQDIRTAFDELLGVLEAAGLPYCRDEQRNSELLSPLGTVKRTYCMPRTMWRGALAWKEKPACLLVDFHGLKEFSAQQLTSTLEVQWPSLRCVRLTFPGTEGLAEVGCEHLAARLDAPASRQALARAIAPHLEGALVVGLPAVLGLTRSLEVVSELESLLKVPVFEIPTMPISVPGMRLREAFVGALGRLGATMSLERRVLSVTEAEGVFLLRVGAREPEYTVRARSVLLASGRFFGRGLVADRKTVREPLFDLPVAQPNGRASWHRSDALDPLGHPINQAGLLIDPSFRPLGRDGKLAHERLYAAGSILAHQDWMRTKSGSGIAIATAYGAVRAFTKTMSESDRISS